jgi:universal stress protein E
MNDPAIDSTGGTGKLGAANGPLPRRILVVVDPATHEQPAVDKAAQFAAASGASLELYVCDVEQDIPESWAGPSRDGHYRRLRAERITGELRRLAAPLNARGIATSVVSHWHAPLEEGIGHHVIRSNPDLVIKATNRHPAAPRVALTHTDWILIRQIPVPLLLVGTRPWAQPPRIAAAVDPCNTIDHPACLDAAIVDQARMLAGALGGTVEVCHVLRSPPHLPGEAVPPAKRDAAHVRAREAVELLARRVGASAVHLTEGRLVESLARLVGEKSPDMLVMGAVARPRWIHSAASGTAAQLLERVACDLLVVKPQGFISPLLVTEE